MKKLICLLSALILMLCIAIPVFAYDSKENPGEEYKVSVFNTIGGTVRYYTDNNNNKVLIAEPYDGHKFTEWRIEGKYEIISGDLHSEKIIIRALGDVTVIAVYDDGSEIVEPWSGNKSPKTGYGAVSAVSAVAIGTASLFGCAYCLKKAKKTEK